MMIPTTAEKGERTPSKAEEESAKLVIPGEAEDVADEISEVGVEGRPGDPKSGPNLLRWEIAGVGIVLLLIAAATGAWFGGGVGLMVLGIGALGMIFNPVFAATLMRARDRDQVVDRRIHHRSRHP